MELNDILQVERDTEETTASGSIVAKGERAEENNSGTEVGQTKSKSQRDWTRAAKQQQDSTFLLRESKIQKL